jgi:hypothetical protein
VSGNAFGIGIGIDSCRRTLLFDADTDCDPDPDSDDSRIAGGTTDFATLPRSVPGHGQGYRGCGLCSAFFQKRASLRSCAVARQLPNGLSS